MQFGDTSKRIFNSAEEVISMFLGLAIVVVVIGLVFTFIRNHKGDISLPGVSNNIDITKVEEKNKNASQPQTQEESTKAYTVTKGDNLWKIAQAKYGNGDLWPEIAKANNLKNPRVLYSGQKLTIPEISNDKIASKSPSTTPTSQSVNQQNTNKIEGSEYTVTKNDSLWKIAVRAYGDGYQWTKIWEANKKVISNPSIIHSGTKLVLPNLKG
jgi:nucleoid-associated protein YgaU